MKFVILDGFLVHFDGLALAIEGHEQVWHAATAPGEVVERIGDAEGAIVNRTQVGREVMAACPRLRFIGTLSTGYNMVDLAAAREFGITVCNVPGYSTQAVAQHAAALLLDIAGPVTVFGALVRGGGWCKGSGRTITAVPTFELAGKTLGIYGMGEIGTAFGRVASALGMQVLGYRRNPPGNAEFPMADADTLLSRSDVVSVHCPLNEGTKGLFDARTIAKMKDGAILLNTARGAVLDEAAVAAALDSGKLAAFGADVLATEPPEPGNPLARHPKAVITPHVAWLPRETRERLLGVVSANILAFTKGSPQNVVNL